MTRGGWNSGMPTDWIPPAESEDLTHEQIIWRNEKVEGFWTPKTTESQIITDKRVVFNDNAAIFLKDIIDVVAVGTHVVFMSSGGNITFSDIPDPVGVVMLTKAACKAAKALASNDQASCNKCGAQNINGARFCNSCGFTLR